MMFVALTRVTAFVLILGLSVFSCLVSSTTPQPSLGVLRLGARKLHGFPESFTPTELSVLVFSELGRQPAASLSANVIEQSQEKLSKFSSSVFEKPSLIIFGFLPSNGQEFPAGIFDEASAPFFINAASIQDCTHTDLQCLRQKTLEFVLDNKAKLLSIDDTIELVQWEDNPKTPDVAKAMVESMRESLKNLELQPSQLLVLKQISDSGVAEIRIDEDSQLFTVTFNKSFVSFPFKNACTRTLIAELSSLQALQSRITSFVSDTSGSHVFILSPRRALKCFRETEETPALFDAAHQLLVQCILRIIASAEKSGRVFSLLTFANNDEQNGRAFSSDSQSTGHSDELDTRSSPSMIEVAARRRLQASSPASSVPRMPLLWLSVILVFVLVLAIIPLLRLSSINDPIISTKLFTPNVHH